MIKPILRYLAYFPANLAFVLLALQARSTAVRGLLPQALVWLGE
ncbi:hypothetical protein [Rhizobium laguerreae]|nr:hypothetical protein [Rhizobium laguerreae]